MHARPIPRRLARSLSFLAVAALAASRTVAAADPPPAKGEPVIEDDCERPAAGWSTPPVLAPGHRGGHAVRIERSAAVTSPNLSRQLPVERIRGCTLRCTAMVKAEDVGPAPQPWNGVKFMLAIETPARQLWPQADIAEGDYDWRRASFTPQIPRDATAVRLILGLEQVTGTVSFDDLRLSISKPPPPRPAPRPGPAFTGRGVPRLRGAMVGPNIDEAGLAVLGRDWNANLVRWQLIRHGRPGEPGPLAGYDQWLEGELERFDAVLPACARHGLLVALDLHSPPGGKATVSSYIGSDDRLFTDPRVQDHFVEVWRRIAARYKGVRTIWGFDLANEPVESFVEEGCLDWHDLAERAAIAIREVDPGRTIICEAPPWGGPDSLADFTPLNLPNVVYSAHMYVPTEFTHQGVHDKSAPPAEYPGVIRGQRWDKPALEAALQPVVEFQRTHNVHIYIGEFSAIRWAPGDSARRYLADVIDIFEKHGWDWSYHAFREWHGWSVEHGPDPAVTTPAPEPTPRALLLRDWFARNQKP